MLYLLDSVIFIDHFNGVDAATRFIAEYRRQIAISVITRAEVLTGFNIEECALAKPFLQSFRTYLIEPNDADLAATLRREYRWKLPDALQVAVAINHGARFVTRNSKDFPPQKHSFVLSPYSLPLKQ